MKLSVPRETAPEERRIAVSPDSIPRLLALGVSVQVERGAGEAAGFSDQALETAGATLAADPKSCLEGSGVVCKVQPPNVDEVPLLPEGATLVSFLPTSAPPELLRALSGRHITAISFELIPRISRAQAMDALSSQASIGGYKAVLMGADRLAKIMPLQMTAAGTIPPSRVLVLGAGVAGLQAIATARRLGAVVEAYDVRPAVREEVRSLGATFVELELDAQEGEGGYAREQSEEFLAKQRELIGQRVQQSDLVVTTAAIPGRRSPVLVTKEMVEGMRAGSVLVDLAAEGGGNCALTIPGEEVVVSGVRIVGLRNLPAMVASTSSQMYARNVATVCAHLVKGGELSLDLADEITNASCAIHAGEIRNELMREAALGGAGKS